MTAGGEYNPVTRLELKIILFVWNIIKLQWHDYYYLSIYRYCEPISARTLSLNRGFGSEFQCTETFNDINQDCFAEDCSSTNGQCSNSPGTYVVLKYDFLQAFL